MRVIDDKQLIEWYEKKETLKKFSKKIRCSIKKASSQRFVLARAIEKESEETVRDLAEEITSLDLRIKRLKRLKDVFTKRINLTKKITMVCDGVPINSKKYADGSYVYKSIPINFNDPVTYVTLTYSNRVNMWKIEVKKENSPTKYLNLVSPSLIGAQKKAISFITR